MDATTFQRTRYEIKSFSSKNYKRVPHEDLDYGIYKNPNLVAFQTTELRLPLWVEAVFNRYIQNEAYNDENNEIRTKLREEDDPCNDSKCEELSVEIIHKDETVLTITIFVTKGRIQIQGRLMKIWGSEEFDHVLAIVNKEEEPKAFTTTFVNKILKKKDSTTTTEANNESDNFPGEKTFTILKNIIANLESEFVTHKVDTDAKLQEVHQMLNKKDKEIEALKEEINNLKTTSSKQQQAISDLSLEHIKIEENTKHIQSELKNEKKKESKRTKPPTDKIAPQTQDEPRSQAPTDSIPTCTIPTTNRFNILEEKNTSPTSNTT